MNSRKADLIALSEEFCTLVVWPAQCLWDLSHESSLW